MDHHFDHKYHETTNEARISWVQRQLETPTFKRSLGDAKRAWQRATSSAPTVSEGVWSCRDIVRPK